MFLFGCGGALQTPAPLPTALPYAPEAVAERGMVVTTDSLASQVGARILRDGGNAFDAAIAVQFALAVVNPEAGNIGGGGYMVATRESGEQLALDFREVAPAAATRDMYLSAAPDASTVGHLAAGVPGSVAGMWAIHERLGSMDWQALVQPAIELARGFRLHERLERSLRDAKPRLTRYPATARIFVPEGESPALGSMFRQPDLAAVLERIATQGRDGFYKGETARLIAEEMRTGHGLITEADLAAYQVKWRTPIVFDYRGYTVVSMPPSSSGGTTLAAILECLEDQRAFEVSVDSLLGVHLFTECERRAFVDRNALVADPDFVDVPVEEMIAPQYVSVRASSISRTLATPSSEITSGLQAPVAPLREGEQTTHYSVVDRDGNAVSITTTINAWYGSLVTVSGAGFILNNEMDDFATRPGQPNLFGLVQGEANAVAGGKRMTSSMTPTIVLNSDETVRLVVGSPGGSTIISTVAAIIRRVLDDTSGLPEAIARGRIHHQHLPDVLKYESGALSAAMQSSLSSMGHALEERTSTQGDVNAIERLPDGMLRGSPDPRRKGAAVGVH